MDNRSHPKFAKSQRECAHPKGLRQRFKVADSIEEAMGVLLEASNEERNVRTRVREASTLLGALDALLEFENLSDDEGQGECHFNEFQEWNFT